MSLSLLFLYNYEWTQEIADYNQGKVPAHRLFGFVDVAEQGHSSLACAAPRALRKLVSRPLLWRVYQALYAMVRYKQIHCIVATDEAAALPVLLLKRLGLCKTPVIVINISLLHPKNCSGRKSTLWKRLLPCAEMIVSYCSAQTEWLQSTFQLPPDRLAFIPLGVDTDFFAVQESECEDFLLSVGTNEGKDFATLLQALPSGTILTIVTDDHNARIIAENMRADCCIEVRQDVPIVELRDLYRRAKLHVIPLRDAEYSSGQTVLLENMSLGRPVIVTKVAATQDYVQNGITAFCVAPQNVEQMRQQITKCLEDEALCRRVGANAAQAVRQYYSAELFAEHLLQIICRIRQKPTGPKTKKSYKTKFYYFLI